MQSLKFIANFFGLCPKSGLYTTLWFFSPRTFKKSFLFFFLVSLRFNHGTRFNFPRGHSRKQWSKWLFLFSLTLHILLIYLLWPPPPRMFLWFVPKPQVKLSYWMGTLILGQKANNESFRDSEPLLTAWEMLKAIYDD